MSEAKKILGTDDAWENGELGNSEEHAALASPDVQLAVENTLAMQMISIRLPQSVIDDFKAIASIERIGYQTLMRVALMRFAEGESRRIMREVAANRKRARSAQDGSKGPGRRKAA
ncbi:MAG: hypothetical protein L0H54_00860 [Alcaligenaceae bacterium]|nr:hypothetical protein [Alcaligenaceae bacterium]